VAWGTTPISASVAGLITDSVSSLLASTHLPLMNSR
jgi:hypothetical protein